MRRIYYFCLALVFLSLITTRVYPQTIKGPAEVKDRPNGKTILFLNDGTTVKCEDCSTSNEDWYSIEIEFRYATFKPSIRGNCKPSLMKGDTLRNSEDKPIGEATDTIPLGDVSGVYDYQGYHCWGTISAFIHKRNVLSGSIIEKNTDFCEALINGNGPKVKMLLSKGVRATTVNEHQQTHVMLAARYGYKDLVQLFLSKGVDVNARDEYGHTALMYAVSNGFQDIAEVLLSNGAKLEEADHEGNTVLMKSLGHRRVMEYLLSRGADVNAKNKKGETLLMIAARIMKLHVSKQNKDLPDEINLLLRMGAKIDMRNSKGEDAFIQAFESPEAMNILASYGADINTQNNKGQTPLMLAANGNYIRSVEFLLAKGADLNRKDNLGRTALWYAKNCSLNCTSVSQILQERGGVIGSEDPYKQTFPCSKLVPAEASTDIQTDSSPSQVLLVQDPQLQGFLNLAGSCRLVLSANYFVHYLSRKVEFKKISTSAFPNIIINFNVRSEKIPRAEYVWNGDRYEREGLKESRALNVTALDLFKKDRIQEAIAIWEQAYEMALMPYSGLTENAEVLNNLAFAYHKLAKQQKSGDYYKKAEQFYKETQVVDYRRWQAYLNLGDLYAEQGNAKDAVQNYEKLIELNPEYKRTEGIRNKIEALKQEVRKGNLLSTIDEVEIAKNAPRFVFKLFGDKKDHSLQRIMIYRDDTGKHVQTVEIEELEVAESPTQIQFEDINFDGHKDIKIRIFAGATGNEGFSYLLYNPKLMIFVRNKDFEGLNRPELIPEKKQFRTYWNMGSAGAEFDETTYEVRNNKPVLIRSITQQYLHSKGYLLRTEKELVNGKLKIVRETKKITLD